MLVASHCGINLRPNAWLLLGGLCLGAASPAPAGSPAEAIGKAPWYLRQIGVGVVSKSHQFENLFGKPQTVYVIEADMKQPGVAPKLVCLTGGARKPVSELAAGVPGAAACINGNFFDGSGSLQYLKADGKVLHPTRNNQIADAGGLVIGADGDARTCPRPEDGWASLPAESVMATNVALINEGRILPFEDTSFYKTDRNPRTMVGVTADNRLLMVVVDGRSKTSAGMTFVEMAETMLALGAWEAVNMDGGGSTTLWDRATAGNGVFNVPSDGAQRPVANAIALLAPPMSRGPEYDARRAPSRHHASPYAPVKATVAAGQSTTVTLSFVNSGTAAWTPETVTISRYEVRPPSVIQAVPCAPFGAAVASGKGDPVAFFPGLPATLDQNNVPPGGAGTFTFAITPPVAAEESVLTENFILVNNCGIRLGPRHPVMLTVTPAK